MAAVYLSYPPQDADLARQLREALTTAGYTPVLDRGDTPGGFPQAEWIANAVMGCRALLILLSPGAAADPELVQELNLAETYQRPIIPIVAQPTTVPASLRFQIADRRRIDFTQQPFERAFSELQAALDDLPPDAAAILPNPAAREPRRAAPAGWTPRFGETSFPVIAAFGALLLGLASPCAWLLPGTGGQIICVPLLSVTGIVLGFFGLRSNRRGIALIGIVLSILSVSALCLLSVFFASAAFLGNF